MGDIRFEGYLVKRAVKSGRNWKKRYFVLHNTILWYFKTKADSKPRGEIRITKDTSVVESRVREFCLEIATPKVVLVACALTRYDQKKWLQMLNQSVTLADSLSKASETRRGIGNSIFRRFAEIRPPRRTSSNTSANSTGSKVKSVPVGKKVSNVIPTKARKMRETHTFNASGTSFEVDSRYTFMRPIGHGAYGVVVSANDAATNENVAIKKVTNAFEDLIDAKRILREIKLLRHFDHENVIHIRDLLPPRSYEDYDDIYIVSELMETDLHRVIYSKQALSDEHIQYFIYQILRAIKYIHSANVLHRDLKPSNLLLNSNCDLKVCDFGLARGVEHDAKMVLTEYVVTRWYRAPEIMLACREYTKAIDMWSIGCIFAELLGRKPLFPGENYIDQLRIITDIIGNPPEEDLQFINSEKAKRFMRNLSFKPKVPWSKVFPKASPDALDLLEKMLQFNPEKRISVLDALAHPYLKSLHHIDDEPVHDTPFAFDDSKPNAALNKRELQAQIAQEILAFHPEEREKVYQDTRPLRSRNNAPRIPHFSRS